MDLSKGMEKEFCVYLNFDNYHYKQKNKTKTKKKKNDNYKVWDRVSRNPPELKKPIDVILKWIRMLEI